jgi:hypothetical protein
MCYSNNKDYKKNTLQNVPGYQKLSWSNVVMDFQIIVEALCQIIF